MNVNHDLLVSNRIDTSSDSEEMSICFSGKGSEESRSVYKFLDEKPTHIPIPLQPSFLCMDDLLAAVWDLRFLTMQSIHVARALYHVLICHAMSAPEEGELNSIFLDMCFQLCGSVPQWFHRPNDDWFISYVDDLDDLFEEMGAIANEAQPPLAYWQYALERLFGNLEQGNKSAEEVRRSSRTMLALKIVDWRQYETIEFDSRRITDDYPMQLNHVLEPISAAKLEPWSSSEPDIEDSPQSTSDVVLPSPSKRDEDQRVTRQLDTQPVFAQQDAPSLAFNWFHGSKETIPHSMLPPKDLSPLYSHFDYPPISHQIDSKLLVRQWDTPPPFSDWSSRVDSPSAEATTEDAKGSVYPLSLPIKRTARHSSISSSSPKTMYSRGDSMPLGPKLKSFSSMTYESLPGSSYTTTPTMGAGFSQEQIPAALAILQFMVERPTEPIPSPLITEQLAEISGGRGYCLIGNCGVERARQKNNPGYDASKDTRKRADHLFDHIKDKHFNCRPFQCSQCPRSFSREHDLERHEAVHNPKIFPCHMCPRTYTNEDNLKRHISLKHEVFTLI